MACAGDKTSTCGGNWALTAFKASSIAVVAPPPPVSSSPSNSSNVSGLPTGWTALGCRKDNVAGRTLDVDAYTSVSNMTIAACISHCSALGHSLAGLEYARECYCGSAFVNGGGAVLADSACDMPCSGDAQGTCGGPDALSVFQNANAGKVARRAHKARAFGRAHQHSDMF